ncbi:alpha-galactosidase [Foetidibacter luteolus]|uniref:alpha-galactosidase n=1 Tax=Foetidibacter luteolus TaxID=2608880 RepID=UPI00129BD252|nr:alpha-galactosidase [Foetidibacter luteolus]
MKDCRCLFLICLLLPGLYSLAAGQANYWVYDNGQQKFEWDVVADKARVYVSSTNTTIWQGSLLPAFWLQVNNRQQYIKAVANTEKSTVTENNLSLTLRIGNYGTGKLSVSKENWGIRFSALSINWGNTIPAIIEMYFGTSAVHPDSNVVSPNWERPFMPDWQSFGFCIPGAKGGTVQSYFRMWDFGQANVALGGFGPALGAPYGAAYPRPLYYAGMGSDAGFAVAGAGSIPDAPMMLRVQATSACLQYIYREDIWGAPVAKERTWNEPLRITMAAKAYDAFRSYYSSFPGKQHPVAAAKAIWNTWGLWREKKYAIKPIADFAKTAGSEIMVLDDPWESSQGSGKPNLQRFPNFFEDIDYIHQQGLQHGVWETVGWISNPAEAGLTDEDLLLKKNGKACRANWSFSPWGESYYCLDISSQRTRNFIKKRTEGIMKTVKPALIKLDFGYGFPDPSVAVAKNPAYRGERFAYELVKLIAETAKSINPDVIIMYYSISPLWLPVMDLVSMDDQGDLWYDIKPGHQQWSIWGSLIAEKGMAVNGSSGYDWQTDDEVLLNSAVVGSPGSVLPSDYGEDKISPLFVNRRLAVNKWHRKTLSWKPLWFNSHAGGFTAPPELQCWGRLEASGNGTILTSVALRAMEKGDLMPVDEHLQQVNWQGRWALIAQDTADISSSKKLAVIPFDEGWISLPYNSKPRSITILNTEGEKEFTRWQWQDGKLMIKIDKELLKSTAGYLIER